MQHHLASLAAGQPTHVAPPREGDLDGFLASLATAWQHGEVRETHRTAPRAARDWRTRNDPFARVWPSVRAWLEAEPDLIGQDLVARLQAELPGVFPDGQRRTFQRRVREWRYGAARSLMLAGATPAAAQPCTARAKPLAVTDGGHLRACRRSGAVISERVRLDSDARVAALTRQSPSRW